MTHTHRHQTGGGVWKPRISIPENGGRRQGAGETRDDRAANKDPAALRPRRKWVEGHAFAFAADLRVGERLERLNSGTDPVQRSDEAPTL